MTSFTVAIWLDSWLRRIGGLVKPALAPKTLSQHRMQTLHAARQEVAQRLREHLHVLQHQIRLQHFWPKLF